MLVNLKNVNEFKKCSKYSVELQNCSSNLLILLDFQNVSEFGNVLEFERMFMNVRIVHIFEKKFMNLKR